MRRSLGSEVHSKLETRESATEQERSGTPLWGARRGVDTMSTITRPVGTGETLGVVTTIDTRRHPVRGAYLCEVEAPGVEPGSGMAPAGASTCVVA